MDEEFIQSAPWKHDPARAIELTTKVKQLAKSDVGVRSVEPAAGQGDGL
jgi:hypothetical protein